jgi:hypothetical protein
VDGVRAETQISNRQAGTKAKNSQNKPATDTTENGTRDPATTDQTGKMLDDWDNPRLKSALAGD